MNWKSITNGFKKFFTEGECKNAKFALGMIFVAIFSTLFTVVTVFALGHLWPASTKSTLWLSLVFIGSVSAAYIVEIWLFKNILINTIDLEKNSIQKLISYLVIFTSGLLIILVTPYICDILKVKVGEHNVIKNGFSLTWSSIVVYLITIIKVLYKSGVVLRIEHYIANAASKKNNSQVIKAKKIEAKEQIKMAKISKKEQAKKSKAPVKRI